MRRETDSSWKYTVTEQEATGTSWIMEIRKKLIGEPSLEQAAQRDCGVFILGIYSELKQSMY